MAYAVCVLAFASCIAVVPALAAPRCSIDPIRGLLGSKGARVTMRVSDNDQACGTRLWVRKGSIPFTRLQQVKAPEHGVLTLNDPTRFEYQPESGYRGPDSFEIIAFGDSRGGAAITGHLHVAVSVSLHR